VQLAAHLESATPSCSMPRLSPPAGAASYPALLAVIDSASTPTLAPHAMLWREIAAGSARERPG